VYRVERRVLSAFVAIHVDGCDLRTQTLSLLPFNVSRQQVHNVPFLGRTHCVLSICAGPPLSITSASCDDVLEV